LKANPDPGTRLEDLYGEIREDTRYRTLSMGTRFVPGHGPARAGGVVFVGEAPGKEEERRGVPFVGAAGRNLDQLLEGIGWARSEVFVTNLLKDRPFNARGDNRSPTVSEGRVALPYLRRKLGILRPKGLACLGWPSAGLSWIPRLPG